MITVKRLAGSGPIDRDHVACAADRLSWKSASRQPHPQAFGSRLY